MDLLTKLVYHAQKGKLNAIDSFMKQPIQWQEKTLSMLLKTAASTNWGKKYGYKHIDSIAKYQTNVPVNDYESLKSWIQQARTGEKNVLWPGVTKWFARSSGTTQDKSKFIPVTDAALKDCHYRSSASCLAVYLRNYPNSRILSGKNLIIGGSRQIDSYSSNIQAGDLSAILISNQPSWANRFRAPSSEIALIHQWEEKIAKITPIALKENITNFAGVPSWNLVFLKHLLKVSGKSNILEIWPSLELFIHGGMNFSPYKDQFKSLIPSDNMHYMETYNASEGFFALQDDISSNDMLLMLNLGIFYEFIPMAEINNTILNPIPLSDVKIGVNYAMVISTNAGLWRYIIGDTVSFTSISPYKIKITGRIKQFINTFGEEVIVDNTDKALATACSATNAHATDYTVAPIYMDSQHNGAHEWVIEFDKMPDDLNVFKVVLDQTLCKVNSDYEAKRSQNVTLRQPIVHAVPVGIFYEWMKKKNKLGGQNKVPRLSNQRNHIEEILSICTSQSQEI